MNRRTTDHLFPDALSRREAWVAGLTIVGGVMALAVAIAAALVFLA